MLQTQLIDLKFINGADTKTDDKNVKFLSFQNLENYRINKIGKVVPRGGWSVLDAYSTRENPFECVADEKSIVSGTSTYLRSTTSTAELDLQPALRGTLSRAYYGRMENLILDVAASPTLICLAWVDISSSVGQRNLGILVQEASSGRIVYQSVTTIAVSVNTQVKVVYVSGSFVVFYADTSFDMKARIIDNTNPANPTSLLTWSSAPTGSSAMRFSACSDGSNVYLAYAADSSATVSLQVLTLSGSTLTVASSGSAFTLSAAAKCIATALNTSGGANFSVVAGADGNHYKGILKTSALSTIGSERTVSVGADDTFLSVRHTQISSASFTGAQGVFWVYNTASDVATSYNNDIRDSGFSTAVNVYGGLRPLTGIYRDTRNFFFCDSYTSPTYGSQPLVSSLSGALSSGILGVGMNIGTYISNEQPQCPDPVTVGSKTFFAIPAITSVEDFDSAVPTPAGTIVKAVTLTPRIQASLVELDNSVFVKGALEHGNGQNLYIGNTAVNTSTGQPPNTVPENLVQLADLSMVAGGTEAAGIVSFCFAKLIVGPDGNEYRTYSEIFTVDAAVNTRIQFTLRSWDFDTTGRAPLIELYRTERNGTVFYLSTAVATSGTTTDTSIDADLIEGRLADINGNELPPSGIPIARIVSKFRDRLCMVPADYPNKIFFEKPQLFPSGTVFAPGLEIEVPEEGGPITALIQMDAALYVFKRNSVMTIYGDPPGPTGEGGSLTLPQVIIQGVGCQDPRSAILTKDGILFKSEKGFYFIARNQQCGFIGEGPFDHRTATVIGSGISSDQSEVYFLHNNGYVWVLNLDTRAWYRWTVDSSAGGLAASNSEIFVVTNTAVIQDSTNTTDPSSALIPTDLTTGWINLSGIRGFQRVKRLYLLGENLANCTLTIDVLVDYSSTPVQTFTIDTSSADWQDNPFQIDLHMKRQKCEAMAFRIRSDRVGISLSGASIEIGVKTGVDKSAVSGSNPRG